MEQCDMTCSKCLYSENISDNIDFGECANDVITSIVCNLNPDWRIISYNKVFDKFPDIETDPDFHFCGHGKWVDENGKIIGYLDAEDALVRE